MAAGLVAVATILFSMHNTSAAEVGYRGAGHVTCYEWVDESDPTGATGDFVRNWIDGYWTGFLRPAAIDDTGEFVSPYLKAMFTYCLDKANAKQSLFDAARNVQRGIAPGRSNAR